MSAPRQSIKSREFVDISEKLATFKTSHSPLTHFETEELSNIRNIISLIEKTQIITLLGKLWSGSLGKLEVDTSVVASG